MRSIASLKFLDAQGRKDAAEKRRSFDEACDWYQKALAVEPRDKESHFMLGLVALAVFNSEWNAARARLKTNPEIDGVLPDAAVRADLRARFGKVISDGMGHLRRAAEIDPQYSSALVTLNSLLREYASLSDTAGECRRLEAEADRWGEQGLAAQRQASGNGRTSSGAAPQPPPPPPPPPHPVQAGAAPRRMLKISPDSVTRDW
jgi:tetratricopeptide (TPR) repeat protein